MREATAIDPAATWRISQAVAAAHFMKPKRMLIHTQVAKVTVLKEVSPNFAVICGLAMRFRGPLRDADTPGYRLEDARHSGIYALNAVADPWSSGQAGGQINRLKARDRACSAAQASNRSGPGNRRSNNRSRRKVEKTPIDGQATPA